jgi:hypothetical protein
MLNVNYRDNAPAYFEMLRTIQAEGKSEVDMLEAVTRFLDVTGQLAEGLTISEVIEITKTTLESVTDTSQKKHRKS